ncbi:MAG: aminodeoxychorismate/anthranilate synthase component II [Rhodospirillaceae bacterium]|nr:MAG: aminodeoxychorismate/anthranilate synthase component II [Rhodospirillaceae bacterium]
MFLLIDNYDSFTYNLLHFLGDQGAEVEVQRNDAITADQAVNGGYEGIILSPGPCDPDQAGICLDVIAKAPKDLAILGVCLGHQAIGQHFGGKVVQCATPMHGKVSEIPHQGQGIFKDLPSPLTCTRYHSLMVQKEGFPSDLTITAQSADGVIQGLQHKTRPIFGVQFHPESIASEYGHELLQNFIDIARNPTATPARSPK